jgi:hypothetical protein
MVFVAQSAGQSVLKPNHAGVPWVDAQRWVPLSDEWLMHQDIFMAGDF